jgi:predicted Na+-dependent transporter
MGTAIACDLRAESSSALACRLLRFPPKEAIAVLIMSSQKTMPFAVSIIALFPASLGSKGLLTLPPLVSQVSHMYHAMQHS